MHAQNISHLTIILILHGYFTSKQILPFAFARQRVLLYCAKAVFAYITSEQILPFAFARQGSSAGLM